MSLKLIFTGPSGAGKSTLIKRIKSENTFLHFSISCTTRNQRKNELQGKDYYFLSREEFKNKIKNDEFLEHENFNGNLYGTLKSEFKGNVIADLERKGVKRLKEIAKDDKSYIFIFIYTSKEDMIKRLIERSTDSLNYNDMTEEQKKEFESRLKEQEEDILLLKEKNFFDIVILNENGKLEDKLKELVTKINEISEVKIKIKNFDEINAAEIKIKN